MTKSKKPDDKKQTSKGVVLSIDEQGLEKLDPTPMEIPLNMRRPETSDERIRRIITHSLSVRAQEMGHESFEEADDFDIPDDPVDPNTPWEKDFDAAAINASERGIVTPPKKLAPGRQEEILNKYYHKKTQKNAAPPEAATRVEGGDAAAPSGGSKPPPEAQK